MDRLDFLPKAQSALLSWHSHHFDPMGRCYFHSGRYYCLGNMGDCWQILPYDLATIDLPLPRLPPFHSLVSFLHQDLVLVVFRCLIPVLIGICRFELPCEPLLQQLFGCLVDSSALACQGVVYC